MKRFKAVEFAHDLSEWRKFKNFSFAQAGEVFGLSHTQMWRIECKKSVIPHAEAFLNMCLEMGKEPLSYLEK